MKISEIKPLIVSNQNLTTTNIFQAKLKQLNGNGMKRANINLRNQKIEVVSRGNLETKKKALHSLKEKGTQNWCSPLIYQSDF